MEKSDLALIFDLDGTLWNACSTIAEAWDKVRLEFKINREAITKKDVENICGLSTDKVFEKIYPNDHTNAVLITKSLQEQEALLKVKGGELYEGVREGLIKLSSKYDLYIVSNCQVGYIDIFLEVNNLRTYFKDYACYGDLSLPKSENIKRVIKRNNISKAIYFGDTQGDKDAALANALPFVYCKYGLSDISHDVVIPSFSDIYKELKNY